MNPTDQTQKWKPGDVIVVSDEWHTRRSRYIVSRVTARFVEVGHGDNKRRLSASELRRAHPEGEADLTRYAQERLDRALDRLLASAADLRGRQRRRSDRADVDAAAAELDRLCRQLDAWVPPSERVEGAT